MSNTPKRIVRASEAGTSETPPSKLVRRTTTGGIATPSTQPLEGTERVKVVVRMRPPHSHETSGGVGLEADGQTMVLQRNRNASVAQTDFKFDKVLGPEATQADVYGAAVKPIVEAVMKGYNGTIMAYGQTGAGKTYTLSSVQSADNIGMMPRAAAEIFSEIAADSSHIYNVMMGYVQIYMELIQDLLKPENENLQIRESSNGVFIAGVDEQPVRSTAECLRLMQLGDQNRKVAFTHLNAHSSRSHAIVMLTVIKRRRSSTPKALEQEKLKVGKLFIVDLAGSERLKKSQSTGQRASEAKAINLSLTTLGICINARADPLSKHVPFRDSKLTRLLQESLGGNAKTSLVVAVANAIEHADETLQSLQFGSRAMHVQTKAVVNESLGSKLLTADFLANLSNLDISPCRVDANLLAKEEEIERIQEVLQEEKDKASKMIAAFQAEKESAQADQKRVLSAAHAQIDQQRQEVQRHEAQLKQAQEEAKAHSEHQEEQIRQLQHQLGTVEESLKQLRNQHQADLDEARLAHGRELAAAAQKYATEVAAVQEALRLAEEDKQEAYARLEHQRQGLSEEKKRIDEGAAELVRKAERAAEELLLEQRDAWTRRERALEAQQEKATAALADLQSQLESLQQQHGMLSNDHSSTTAETSSLRSKAQNLEESLAENQKQLNHANKQLAGLERSNSQLKSLWLNNRRLNDAARIIQKRYKAWRLCALKDQSSKDAHALVIARRDKCNLEGEKAAMERDQHRHLVWSGQALVASSLLALEEAVQQIRTAFLLPSRELKTLGTLKNRMSVSPVATCSPRTGHYSPSPLSRAISFVSDTSASSFVARSAAPDSSLAANHLGPLKQPANKGQIEATNIQAHWGTPAK